MTGALATVRRMLEHTGRHPVVSVYFDLDPAEFATAPARSTELRSLMDEAERAGRDYAPMNHEDRTVLRADLNRLEEYLQSDELPVSGAATLAVFCSGRDDLFETVELSDPVSPRVVVAATPYVEPLVTGPRCERWCVVLVSRRTALILSGELGHGPAQDQVREQERVTDDVHGRSHSGGWSQANYERSYDDEAEHHLRRVAHELYQSWQREPFARLVLGGPTPDVDRFAEQLHNDLRPRLSPARLNLDAEVATIAQVRDALRGLRRQERAAEQERVLTELGERVERDGAAATGLADVLEALNEGRVETLVLALSFAASGARCPSCGLLYADSSGACPVDGSELSPVADVREAAIGAAVLQDAGTIVIGEGSDPPPPVLRRPGGIGALLRF
ncbi:MAG: Vms1/Ankzf1 family peptidyl-tRNA hydrolase [Solirubrobacteraceae bacterium]